MERLFWKAALAVGGLGVVGAFLLWSLYKEWLHLPIFSKMDRNQTFLIMLVFLVLTFGAFLILVVLHFLSKGKSISTHAVLDLAALYQAWNGCNTIDSTALVGPDVVKAVNCLSLTAALWNKHRIDEERKEILSNFGDSYIDLYDTLAMCNKTIPGFEKNVPPKTCLSTLTPEMMRVANEMKACRGRE